MAIFRIPASKATAISAHIGIFLLSALFLTSEVMIAGDRVWNSVAYADDGDDGDGDNGDDSDSDDGDDDDGSAAGSGRSGAVNAPGIFRIFRNNRPAARRAPSATRAPRSSRAPDEIVATGLDDDDIERLVGQGYVVLNRQQTLTPPATLVRFRIRSGISLEDARTEVAEANSTASADFNHYYRTSAPQTPVATPSVPACEGPGCNARKMIGWPIAPDGQGSCGAGARIGLIDTGINPNHLAFSGGRLEVINSPVEGARRSSLRHGTAVASILIGSAESRTPGLLPDATVFAVDAFYRGKGNDERSDVFTLVRAIDLVSRRDVSVINMSLSGPKNAVLEQAIASLEENDVVVVAAAGNMGPKAKPVYPAAYPGVIAVTAVDHRGRIYRRAGRGEHIDISGPGVEVWIAASVRGARFATGTSYAVPFITAATALVLHDLEAAGHDEALGALAQRALDLGTPGKDDVFGYGLLQAMDLCN
ncbi:S8 family serine peptidase [Nitratireductor sp. XY-223]|uniref:S8 family serine peptidase n=1 Tax=Nitratireductor sp. XY-223 TaxID=2561926 RepID=UPI0010AADC31|nr:S8 family serine peptidase [Nitratireductor sp. XY-223]